MGKYYLGTGYNNQINFQVVDSTGVINDLNLSGLYLSATGKAVDADKLDSYDSSYFRDASNLTGSFTGTLSGTIDNANFLDNLDSTYFLNASNLTGTLGLNATGLHYISGSLAVDTSTLFVDAVNDKVGIGTAVPEARLDIYHASSLNGFQQYGKDGVRFRSPGAFNQHGYIEYPSGGDKTVLGSFYSGGGFGEISLRQHSSVTSQDSLTINSAGNVGIAGSLYADGNVGVGTFSTTSPWSRVLQVYNSNNSALSVKSAARDWQISTTADGKLNIYDNTASAHRLNIDTSGNVGIGTTGPAAKLHIIQTTEADASSGLVVQRTTNDSQLQIGYNSSISGFQIAPTFGSTGAYTPIALFTSAQERMRILANGDVGIGTTSPGALLHTVNTVDAAGPIFENTGGRGSITVKASSTNSAYVQFGNANGNSRAFIDFRESTGYLSLATSFSGGYITFNTDSQVEKMRITSAGNVGIGTTAPDARLSLYSATDLGAGANGIRVHRPASFGQYGYLEYLISSDMTVLGSVYTGSGAGAFGQFTFRQHSSTTSRDSMVLTGAGNVGIGTTSPGATLTVATVDTLIRPALGLRQANALAYGYDFDTETAAVGRLDLYRVVNGVRTQTMSWLQNNGNVGIGTASPGNKLTIVGSSNQLGIGDGSLRYDIGYDDSYLRFKNSAGDTHVVVNWSSGYVGIGTTSPGARLDIAQSVAGVAGLRVYNSHATEPYGLLVDNTVLTTGETYYVADFRSGGTSRLRINSSGNVGIGTGSPTNPLTVLKDQAAYTYINTDNIGSVAAGTGSGFLMSEGGTQRAVIRYERDGSGQLTLISGAGGPISIMTGASVAGATAKMTILTGGNVGIGTPGPTTKLHIYNGASGGTPYGNTYLTVENNGRAAIQLLAPNASDQYVFFGSTTNGAQAYIGYEGLSGGDTLMLHSTSGDITFRAGGSDKMRVKAGGNVGIGTTIPAAKLGLTTLSTTAQQIIMTNGQDNAGDYQEIKFQYSQSSAVVATAIRSIRAVTSNYGAHLAFLTENTAGTFAERMRIDSQGVVSIASTVAGSAGAGALVVAGGLATGAASYLGGNTSVFGEFRASNIRLENGTFIAFGSSDGEGMTGSQSANSLTLRTNSTTALTINSSQAATFASAVTVGGNLTVSGTTISAAAGGGGVAQLNFLGTTGNLNAQIQYDQLTNNTGQILFGTNLAGTFATRLTLTSSTATFAGAVTAAGAIKSTSTYGFSVGDGGAGNARMLYGADGAGIYSLLNASNAYANFNTGPIAVTGTLSTTGAATFAGAVAIASSPGAANSSTFGDGNYSTLVGLNGVSTGYSALRFGYDGSVKWHVGMSTGTTDQFTIGTSTGLTTWTPYLSIVRSTGAATFAGAVTVTPPNGTDGLRVISAGDQSNLYLSNTGPTVGNKNWLISNNFTSAGNFEIRQSNATGGDPRNAGTSMFVISPTGAATFASTVTVGDNLAIGGASFPAWLGTPRLIQFGDDAIYGNSSAGGTLRMLSNLYYSSSGWKRRSAGYGTYLSLENASLGYSVAAYSGSADSAATLTEVFSIAQGTNAATFAGDVSVSKASGGATLTVKSSAAGAISSVILGDSSQNDQVILASSTTGVLTIARNGITTLTLGTAQAATFAGAVTLSGAGSSSTTLASNYAIRINASVTAANYGGIFFDGSTVYDSFFGRVPTALSGINDGVGYVTYASGAPTLRTLFSSSGLAVTGTLTATQNSAGLAGEFVNADTTNGYGLSIAAGGTSATRYALVVRNPAATHDWFKISSETGQVGNSIFAPGAPNSPVVATISTTGLAVTGTVTVTGNVGIGTTVLGTKLDVIGTGQLLTGTTYGVLRGAKDITDYKGVGLGYDSSGQIGAIYADSNGAASNLAFWTYNSGWGERLRIKSNGDVGIGTSTPGAKFEIVAGAADVDAEQIRFGRTNNGADGLRYNSIYSLSQGGGTGRISFRIHDSVTTTSQATVMSLLGNGNVGIGTTGPGARLDIVGAGAEPNLRVTSSSWGDINNAMVIFDSGSTGDGKMLRIKNYGARNDMTMFDVVNSVGTVFAIRGDGNVGIGTTSPGYKLDVVASSNSDGFRVRQGSTSKFILNGDGVLTWGNAADYGTLTWDTGMAIVASQSSTDLKLVAGTAYVYLKNSTGNVGIGTTGPNYKLEVNGSFAATTKSFVIHHPTKEGKKLQYGSLEGPENGVYIRGKTTSKIIELPDYWTKLVDPDSISVQLTAIGSHQKLYVEKIEDNKVYISNESLLAESINCFFYILAERVDVEKLQVEIDG